jgi:hypothetical protein
MVALPSIFPASDVAVGLWTSQPNTSPLAAKVDEAIGSVNDLDYIIGPAGDTSEIISFNLTDMPTDFLSMTDVKIQVRYRVVGRVDDTLGMAAQIYAADFSATLAAGTSGGALKSITTNQAQTTFGNSSLETFPYVNTSATKAQWDNAVIDFRQSIAASMSNDGAKIEVSAIEITGTYVASTPPPRVPTKIFPGAVTKPVKFYNGSVWTTL